MNHSLMMLNNRHGGGGEYVPARVNALARNNKYWKVKKGYNNNRKELRNSGYNNVNQLKPRKHISKKKFSYNSKSVPLAPRNTTSFIIRAKRSGGITSLVSPCYVTPDVLLTPIFSHSSEVLGDMAKEEWGVDGYGSMKGLVRIRSRGNEEECGLNECVIDNDKSRFEMVYPNNGGCDLEDRVNGQDTYIAKLGKENLLLKERLFFIEREFSKLRTRLQSLEMECQGVEGFVKNDSGSHGYEDNEFLKC